VKVGVRSSRAAVNENMLRGKLFTVHTMQAYWKVKAVLHSFLTSAEDGGERSVSRHGRLTAGKRAADDR
jgi:hypothetical protein